MPSSLNCNLCVYLDLTSGANEINMSGCETHERSGRVVILTVFIISSRNVPWNLNKKVMRDNNFSPLAQSSSDRRCWRGDSVFKEEVKFQMVRLQERSGHRSDG